ncbi:MAG: fluoride efflux transporter CrcB [Anaerolineales bacterium]|nr:fluoride efflux transporter CrcB [Anaerolineales bacterium]
MRAFFLIGLGGFLGAVLRYGLSGAVQWLTQSFQFPFGTLAVNILGSFSLVFLTTLAESLGVFGPDFRSFIFIGLLGALTTFSTFSLESMSLVLDGEGILAGINIIANISLCLAAAWFGRAAALWIWG